MSGHNLSISEQLMYSTVRIECMLKNGNRSVGTGFFFRFLDDGEKHIPAIVTNKHVVQGATQGRILMTRADQNGNPINTQHLPIDLENFEQRWIFHPDPEIDLCIMPIGPIIQQVSKMGQKVFYIALSPDLIPSSQQLSELGAIEEIIMIGYPNGIWDRVNNLPIIRKGITATHPKFNYDGREEILIDAACYPGSSGSPVLIYNEGSYSHRQGITIGSRVYLLGILYAGPQFTTTGEIMVMNIPTSPKPISVSQIPMNLGYVIKAHKLLDFNEILQRIINQQ
jgi:Trypsin-like peptidase domain